MRKDWMSTEEVANKLGVSTHTVRRLYEQDEIPVLRLGRKLRIKRTDFVELLERRYKPYRPNN